MISNRPGIENVPHDLSTQNLLAAFLLVEDCELPRSMGDALDSLEKWEINANRHFGIMRGDMRSAISNLGFGWPQTSEPSFCGIDPEHVPFVDYIPTILKFWSVYSNDESSYFEQRPLHYETSGNALRYSLPRGALARYLQSPSEIDATRNRTVPG